MNMYYYYLFVSQKRKKGLTPFHSCVAGSFVVILIQMPISFTDDDTMHMPSRLFRNYYKKKLAAIKYVFFVVIHIHIVLIITKPHNLMEKGASMIEQKDGKLVDIFICGS